VLKASLIRIHLKVRKSVVFAIEIILGLPHPCFMVPYERNQLFTGRDEFLNQLFNQFRDPTPRYHGRLALYGLGGIVKTQVALEFVYRFQNSYTRIYWISGVSQESLLDGYQKIAQQAEIQIPLGSKPIERASRVLAWLKQTQNWLLVVDNLDDIDVLSTSNLNMPNVIETLLPQAGPLHHTLITTRNRHADNIPAQGIEVLLFDKAEAIELLVSSSTISVSSSDPKEVGSLEAIVHELGYLPLAIVQAAAFVKEVTQDFGSFLQQYQAHRPGVHKWTPQGLRSYPHSVATTWLMSFQVVRNKNLPAAELFQLLAFLNPDGVRIDFLQAGAEVLHDDVEQLLAKPVEMAKALLELEKFSLLKWDRTAQTLLIHRLVRAVVKDEMSDTELTTFRSMVIDLCDVAFPDDWDSFEDRVACRDCVGQVMTPLLDVAVVRTETTAGVMFLIGRFLYGDGKSKDSEQLFSRGLEISSQIYGQDHSNTLILMRNLAAAYWRQGKTAEAATLLEEVVQKEKQILGDNDPETLNSMSDLTVMYLDLGKIKEAAVLQEEALQKKMQILAHNHPATLTSMHVLALIYIEQGKMGEAATLQEEVCKKRKQILGDDHPHTLASLNNLASTYHVKEN